MPQGRHRQGGVAIATTLGPNVLKTFLVRTDEIAMA
jgi:hypothetical protein